jgi:hypothetical protein
VFLGIVASDTTQATELSRQMAELGLGEWILASSQTVYPYFDSGTDCGAYTKALHHMSYITKATLLETEDLGIRGERMIKVLRLLREGQLDELESMYELFLKRERLDWAEGD